MGTVDQAAATEHAGGVIKYPRPRLNRMIDNAIGHGEVLVEYRRPGQRLEYMVTVEAQGTIPPEPKVAELAAGVLRRAGVNPAEVRVVWARGTWQEIPSWTGEWFPTPD